MRCVLFCSILVCCFCGTGTVHAQVESDADEEVYEEEDYSNDEDGEVETTHSLVAPDQLGTARDYREERLKVRKFDEKQWREIIGDVDFESAPEKDTERETKSRTLSIPWAGPALRLLSYIVVIAIVVTIIYFIIKQISAELRIKKTEIEKEDADGPVENIESLDINDLLERATREGNFRLALRLYYLGLLKRLNELGVITWRKDKTNRDYLGELFSRGFFFDEIRRLTISYESVWYGEHDLKAEVYRDITTRFEGIYEQINKVPGK